MSVRGACVRWSAAACLLLAPTLLLAGPPLVTDDPDTPGANGYEVNWSTIVTKTRTDLTVSAPYLDMNYGSAENNQFKLELPLVNFVSPEIGEPTAGIGDTLVGYKLRFLDEKEAGFNASTYPQLLVPTGNSKLDIGQGLTNLFLPVELSKHFFDKKLYVYGEAGQSISFSGSRFNYSYLGIAAEWEVNKKFTLMGEVGDFNYPGHGDPDNPFFNVGFNYKFSEHVALIGSAGRSFRNEQFDVPEFTSYLGFQFTGSFKKEKKDDEDKDKAGAAGEKKED